VLVAVVRGWLWQLRLVAVAPGARGAVGETQLEKRWDPAVNSSACLLLPSASGKKHLRGNSP